jgi:MFS family permease
LDNLRFVFALTLLGQFASRATRVLITLYALDLGAGPATVGGLAASFSILPMLLSWPVGRMSDRYGPRWLLAFGSIGAACGIILPYYWTGIAALYVAAALNGLSVVLLNVSLQNLVGMLSTPAHRARDFSNFSLMNSAASFAGPLLAGLVIERLGYADTCLAIAAASLLPALMLLAWGASLPQGSRRAGGGSAGLRAVLKVPGVWSVLAASSLVQSGLDMFQFYMPVYAHGIGLSPSAIGAILAMFAAAGFVVRFVMPRLIAWRSEETVLAYSFYISAASFLLVPFSHSALTLALLSFLFGLGNGCGMPITMMLTFSQSAEGRSGEALGLRATANHLTRLIAPAMFGAIAAVTGLAVVFWINALMLGSGGLLGSTKAKTPVKAGKR